MDFALSGLLQKVGKIDLRHWTTLIKFMVHGGRLGPITGLRVHSGDVILYKIWPIW